MSGNTPPRFSKAFETLVQFLEDKKREDDRDDAREK